MTLFGLGVTFFNLGHLLNIHCELPLMLHNRVGQVLDPVRIQNGNEIDCQHCDQDFGHLSFKQHSSFVLIVNFKLK